MSQLRLSSVTPDLWFITLSGDLSLPAFGSECYLRLLGPCMVRGAATVDRSSVVSTYCLLFRDQIGCFVVELTNNRRWHSESDES